MKVLLSIKPEYVEKIFNGEKKFEYRKQIFKRKINTIVVYSTKPEGKIVGEFSIEEILHDHPKNIWIKTCKYSGISHSFFMEYFGGRSEAYAIKIGRVRLYDNPVDPKEISEPFYAPQSFCYIS